MATSRGTVRAGLTDGDVLSRLQSAHTAVPAALAAKQVPDRPGLYSIFVDTASSVPEPFRTLLSDAKSRLLYVGCASGSLLKRLVEEELNHKRPATFFRGLGAVLGFRPPSGSLIGKANQRNYKFSPADTTKIIAWVARHLSVQWAEVDRGNIARVERVVIRELCPPFNKTHNPRSCAELSKLRDTCRQIAQHR